MPSYQSLTDRTALLTCQQSPTELDVTWFSPSYWESQNAITGSSTGRNKTYFFQVDDRHFVLRHYWRGGMIRRLVRDAYWYRGLQKTRIFAELEILEKMHEWALPVPTPIAGYLQRRGLLYRADIIMECIANAEDVFALLKRRALTTAEWQTLGETIARFHQFGVYHADLNCHNLMLDTKGQPWIIDFDRAVLMPSSPGRSGWQAQNLGRLYRSLLKEKAKHTRFYFDDNHWENLLKGYDGFQHNG